ncbi:hypothetical protein CRG98_043567 [Punica granatum]|uniref:Uncharacterized protein n=1 Tax=Punica granatum TaxID=22663 RepID=A0A2I0HWP5_PUNGR|nr:hypothetical protein CRG98_043567 [Punica granatum]
MVDSRTVMGQALLHEIQDEGMALRESFQVAIVIEKLPLGWRDFKNYLKQKWKEMTMEDLVVKLQIEEDNKNSGKDLIILAAAKVNVMKQGQSSKNKKRSPKRKKDHEANMVNKMARDVANINLYTVVSEVNLIGSTRRNGGSIPVPPDMCSQI